MWWQLSSFADDHIMYCLFSKTGFDKYFLLWIHISLGHLNLQTFFLAPLRKQNLFYPWLMCGEMIACLLSALLLRFHRSVLMVFLPIFKKEGMSNQAFFFLHADIFAE